jgi:hypothetical protein
MSDVEVDRDEDMASPLPHHHVNIVNSPPFQRRSPATRPRPIRTRRTATPAEIDENDRIYILTATPADEFLSKKMIDFNH